MMLRGEKMKRKAAISSLIFIILLISINISQATVKVGGGGGSGKLVGSPTELARQAYAKK